MKVAVTGGAGFMGSHLCEALSNLDNSVTILDNLSSGAQSNIQEVLGSAGKVDLIVGDCKNPVDVKRAISGAEFLYHFAANPEVRLELADPSACFRENVYATHILLEQVKESGVDTIVFASTSTVYGDAKVIPTPEDHSPLKPISIYGASKLASEALITAYCHTYQKKAIILRFANIVGLRSRHGIIHDFITKLSKNPGELEILGDGAQTKSYLHVTDCIEAILIAAEKSRSQVEICNVGSEDEVDVKSIAKIVIEEMELGDVNLKLTGGVDGGRGWIGDVKHMRLDIGMLKSLGWKPNHNSREAIRLAVREELQTRKAPP